MSTDEFSTIADCLLFFLTGNELAVGKAIERGATSIGETVSVVGL